MLSKGEFHGQARRVEGPEAVRSLFEFPNDRAVGQMFLPGTSPPVKRIESLERRVDVAEFVAIARAVGIDAEDLFRLAIR